MSGVSRIIASNLTPKKLKGKSLVAAQDADLSTKHMLNVNRKVTSGNPTGGQKVGKKGSI